MPYTPCSTRTRRPPRWRAAARDAARPIARATPAPSQNSSSPARRYTMQHRLHTATRHHPHQTATASSPARRARAPDRAMNNGSSARKAAGVHGTLQRPSARAGGGGPSGTGSGRRRRRRRRRRRAGRHHGRNRPPLITRRPRTGGCGEAVSFDRPDPIVVGARAPAKARGAASPRATRPPPSTAATAWRRRRRVAADGTEHAGPPAPPDDCATEAGSVCADGADVDRLRVRPCGAEAAREEAAGGADRGEMQW